MHVTHSSEPQWPWLFAGPLKLILNHLCTVTDRQGTPTITHHMELTPRHTPPPPLLKPPLERQACCHESLLTVKGTQKSCKEVGGCIEAAAAPISLCCPAPSAAPG